LKDLHPETNVSRLCLIAPIRRGTIRQACSKGGRVCKTDNTLCIIEYGTFNSPCLGCAGFLSSMFLAFLSMQPRHHYGLQAEPESSCSETISTARVSKLLHCFNWDCEPRFCDRSVDSLPECRSKKFGAKITCRICRRFSRRGR
jgi:hypothetical protein